MVADRQLRELLESSEVRERLAATEHERWAHWQQYVHEQCERRDDGSLVIPAELVERWSLQIATPYDELTEAEKDSDREQVGRYLPIILAALDDDLSPRGMQKRVGQPPVTKRGCVARHRDGTT